MRPELFLPSSAGGEVKTFCGRCGYQRAQPPALTGGEVGHSGIGQLGLSLVPHCRRRTGEGTDECSPGGAMSRAKVVDKVLPFA